MTLKLLGLLGSIFLSICTIPEVFRTIKHKKTFLSDWFLILWGIGEILSIFYVVFSKGNQVLLANYLVNAIFLLIIFKYRLKNVKNRD